MAASSMAGRMRAAVLHGYGSGPVVQDVERPTPAAGELLVRIEASGVNPLDIKIRDGAAAHARSRLPAILGIDLTGRVEGVGAGVTGFAIGDRVYGMTGGVGGLPGSLAEFVAVDAHLVARAPANWGARQAASAPLAAITAWEALVDRGHVSAGDLVLVHGGAGGVGHLAIQLALARGATAYATSGAADLAAVERLGATAIDYAAVAPADYVREYTDGAGFDVVLDTVGGAVLDASFAVVRHYTGRVISTLGWGTHDLAPLSFRGASYSGVFTLLPLLTGHGREHHGEILRRITGLAEAGRLTPLVDDREFTLDSLDDAHALVRNRESRGKVVVSIDASATSDRRS